MHLLITGSEGLVGTRLVKACTGLGHKVTPFDLIRPGAIGTEDICDVPALSAAARDCDGIIHLAAISRVAWGEERPALCEKTNVDGTRAVVDVALASDKTPWLLFASSREVYGNPERLQVLESDPVAPFNSYGRSKAEGERLVNEARAAGLRAAIIRLSNVYGGRRDHPDRAAPALMTRALAGEDLIITGGDNYFDFVHVDDCVDGLLRVVERLAAGEDQLPPVHFATGVATSLRALAQLAAEIGGGHSRIVEAPGRPFDVAGFCGAPDRARELLGWSARIDLCTGLEKLAEDLRLNGPLDPVAIPDPADLRPGRADK